ncbi:hypothetical protein V1524DRAFT_411261 [Lipomyces starkeyi]
MQLTVSILVDLGGNGGLGLRHLTTERQGCEFKPYDQQSVGGYQPYHRKLEFSVHKQLAAAEPNAAWRRSHDNASENVRKLRGNVTEAAGKRKAVPDISTMSLRRESDLTRNSTPSSDQAEEKGKRLKLDRSRD